VNLGAQYTFSVPSIGKIFLRGGYKSLLMEDSQFGLSLGFGVMLNLMHNKAIKVEYAFRKIGILGNNHCYGISIMF
jgi:opacity protein-like surface antigen